MLKFGWMWTAAASVAFAATAVLLVPATPAHSEDGGSDAEEHHPPADCALVADAIANWDDDGLRETALAAYLGFDSSGEALAPFEDPAYLDNH